MMLRLRTGHADSRRAPRHGLARPRRDSRKTGRRHDAPAPETADEDEEDEGDSVPLGDDPNVLKSEIDDIRKSVVSMSVGQPGRTSTIVKEWLEQPAPEPPVSEETSDDGDSGDEEKSGEE